MAERRPRGHTGQAWERRAYLEASLNREVVSALNPVRQEVLIALARMLGHVPVQGQRQQRASGPNSGCTQKTLPTLLCGLFSFARAQASQTTAPLWLQPQHVKDTPVMFEKHTQANNTTQRLSSAAFCPSILCLKLELRLLLHTGPLVGALGD